MPHQPKVHGKIIAKFPGLDYRNRGLFHPVAARFTLAHCWAIALSVLILHALIWSAILGQSGQTWPALLQHWDAGWYLQIATEGYDPARAAFLPLFPFLVRGLASLLGLQNPAAMLWIGTIFSTLCFFASLIVIFARSRKRPNFGIGFGAALFLLWSPASYIFHSFHTESLFLLLSVLGFLAFYEKKWWLAALWAGLAALVRHQGVFLAMALAFGGMLGTRGLWPKILVFSAMGLISASLWGLTPLFHFLEGRGWFPAMSAHQSHWFVADSWQSYFKTFLLANPIQNFRYGSLLHHAFYGLWVAGALLVLRQGRVAEGFYCLLSLAVMPLQGELVDAFRFGAILFPLLFVLGEIWESWPRWLAWPVLGGYVALNLLVTWQYGISRWAY